MLKFILLLLLVSNSFAALAAKNLVIVTIDGLRWQEVFHGADLSLIDNKKFVENSVLLKDKYWRASKNERREVLMPFIWKTVAKQGVIIGDRDIGSKMSVANNWYFSYPGYSEIFTGVADNSINSNKKIANKNVSFLEWLNNNNSFKGNVAAFGGWDVFPYIFNTKRSHLYVNAGFMPLTETTTGYAISQDMKLLNQLQKEVPSPWHNVRFDSFTYRFAKDYLLNKKPRVLTISLGETDDFAHDGHYDQYIKSTQRSDAFIADLWHTIQNTAGYKDNTVLLITTDHGRGSSAQDWQHHASKLATETYMKDLNKFKNGIVGSNNIWFAAIGADIKPQGEIVPDKEIKQNQIAATALTLLGEDPKAFNAQAGEPIMEILK
ncbi:MAG: phosphoglyceromutase [Alteromonadaceae bacterium]|nr:phosphoglyceromutase [Alteromonadaceae bacterium]